jgi:hypothetical protein
MLTDKELTAIPVLEAWLHMCTDTPEFVDNYNRLRGTKLRFTLPPRSGIEQAVDRACGMEPSFGNDEAEQQRFFEDCKEILLHLPMLNDPKNFQPMEAT